MNDTTLNRTETAKILGVSIRQTYRLEARGVLIPVRPGARGPGHGARFDRAQVQSLAVRRDAALVERMPPEQRRRVELLTSALLGCLRGAA